MSLKHVDLAQPEATLLHFSPKSTVDSICLYEAIRQPQKIKFFEIPGYPNTLLSVYNFSALLEGRYQFWVAGPKGGLGTVTMENPLDGYIFFSFRYDTLENPTYQTCNLDHVRCWYADEPA